MPQQRRDRRIVTSFRAECACISCSMSSQRMRGYHDGAQFAHSAASSLGRACRSSRTIGRLATNEDEDVATFSVGYFVGSLAKKSINRRLALSLTRVAPPELSMREISIGDLPLYSYDYD